MRYEADGTGAHGFVADDAFLLQTFGNPLDTRDELSFRYTYTVYVYKMLKVGLLISGIGIGG